MGKEFLRNESGAVTVDWVVLTGGLVGLGLATMAVVSAGVEDLSGDTRTALESDGIIAASFATAWPEFDFGAYSRPRPDHHTGNWTHLMGSIGSYNETQLTDLMTQGMALYETGDTADIQAWGVDTYSAGYAQMQARGMDVSGLTNPNEMVAGFEAQHGSS